METFVRRNTDMKEEGKPDIQHSLEKLSENLTFN